MCGMRTPRYLSEEVVGVDARVALVSQHLSVRMDAGRWDREEESEWGTARSPDGCGMENAAPIMPPPNASSQHDRSMQRMPMWFKEGTAIGTHRQAVSPSRCSLLL